MRLKVSTLSSLPTAAILVLLLLDIAKPGYRKFLLVPEFKSQMAKKWDEVRPTIDAHFPQTTQSKTPQPKKQPVKTTSPFQQWTSNPPAQLPRTK